MIRSHSFSKFLGVLCWGVAFLWMFSLPVRADNPFSTAMNVTYRVDVAGLTTVRYEIRLKNNVSTVYAKEYALQINSPDVENVSVRNSDGRAEAFQVNQSAQETVITIQFPEDQKVIGRDKERLFTLEYTSKDTASVYGNVLEISVPKLADPSAYQQYNVLIVVPNSFGAPSLVEPAQYNLDTDGDTSVLRFTNVGQDTGISVLFGREQTYSMKLKYHVENASQNVGVVQVALPPDTPFQRVQYTNFDPMPQNISRDADGNWIGEFRVEGEAKASIAVEGQVTIYAHPTVPVALENPLQSHSIGWRQNGEGSPYLKEHTYWQVQHPTIVSIAQSHTTPRAIYQYVVDTLAYNYPRALDSDQAKKRFGAVAALEDPANAMCQEFTDVFVAVARAAGVPARRATGYAVTQNSRLRPLSLESDVLHAWPEYYDTQRNIWVPIDPTWADTTGGVDYFSKLDLRHITFAVQGMNDSLPLPAGLYKLPGSVEKDVAVELLSAEVSQQLADLPKQRLQVERKRSYLPQLGVPTQESFVVKNPTGEARYNVQIAVGLEGEVDILSDRIISLPVVLPYSEHEVQVSLTGLDWFQPSSAELSLLIDDERYSYSVTARRAFQQPIFRWLALGGTIALISAAAGGISIFGLRWLRTVRR